MAHVSKRGPRSNSKLMKVSTVKKHQIYLVWISVTKENFCIILSFIKKKATTLVITGDHTQNNPFLANQVHNQISDILICIEIKVSKWGIHNSNNV